MRWLKFTVVGALGAVLQVGLLALLVRAGGMHYLLATAFSVEAAILHNFVWHQRWTWDDRRGASGGPAAALARFHLTNGLVSIGASLLSACLFTGFYRINPVAANVASIGLGSLANFLLSDQFVFVAVVPRAPRPLWRAKLLASFRASCARAGCAEAGSSRHQQAGHTGSDMSSFAKLWKGADNAHS